MTTETATPQTAATATPTTETEPKGKFDIQISHTPKSIPADVAELLKKSVPGDVLTLDPNHITIDPQIQSREQTPVARWMVDSLKNDGQLTPGKGFVSGKKAVVLTDGHTRWLAMGKVNEELIAAGEEPMRFRLELHEPVRNASEAFWLSWKTNRKRIDPNPIDDAWAMKRMRGMVNPETGKPMNQKEIGDLYSITQGAVSQNIAMLDWPEPLKEEVRTKRLKPGAAIHLSKLVASDISAILDILYKDIEKAREKGDRGERLPTNVEVIAAINKYQSANVKPVVNGAGAGSAANNVPAAPTTVPTANVLGASATPDPPAAPASPGARLPEGPKANVDPNAPNSITPSAAPVNADGKKVTVTPKTLTELKPILERAVLKTGSNQAMMLAIMAPFDLAVGAINEDTFFARYVALSDYVSAERQAEFQKAFAKSQPPAEVAAVRVAKSTKK